ncbi:MAG: DUF1934 domain-containing protein [Clostridia bacterium]|nr:DUF1934 domain-containing protein [Clostridia bacterium]
MISNKAVIRIHGVVASTPMEYEYQGEYAFENNTHLIVYTDYTGNVITKCAIQANNESMLLHRSGAFNGEMFFQPAYPTSVKYTADMLETEMVLHTFEYCLTAEEVQHITIAFRYMLTDPHGMNVIHGQQKIDVTWVSDKRIVKSHD